MPGYSVLLLFNGAAPYTHSISMCTTLTCLIALDAFGASVGEIAVCRPEGHFSSPFGSLSGGQQALATLALSFALQAAFPSPFYFFDEIDCALDTANATRVADYIASQKSAQYLVVSHKPQVQHAMMRGQGLPQACLHHHVTVGNCTVICLAVLTWFCMFFALMHSHKP